eukprot:gene12536-biopygen9494
MAAPELLWKETASRNPPLAPCRSPAGGRGGGFIESGARPVPPPKRRGRGATAVRVQRLRSLPPPTPLFFLAPCLRSTWYSRRRLGSCPPSPTYGRIDVGGACGGRCGVGPKHAPVRAWLGTRGAASTKCACERYRPPVPAAWEKRLRTRPGRVPDASRTIEFEETDASRTRPGRVLGRFSLAATQTQVLSFGTGLIATRNQIWPNATLHRHRSAPVSGWRRADCAVGNLHTGNSCKLCANSEPSRNAHSSLVAFSLLTRSTLGGEPV